jgi:methylated-DNA-protein-cysteine methyltransferase related protein
MSSQPNRSAIFAIIHQIPAGRVATYGQIARLAGLPNGARAVGHALKQLPNDTRLPWHRVINSRGQISIPQTEPAHSLQVEKLRSEGVDVLGGTISLRHFQWQP